MAVMLATLLAGRAQAATVNVHFPGDATEFSAKPDGIHQVVVGGEYVGPYSLAINGGSAKGGSNIWATCFSVSHTIYNPEDWVADVVRVSDIGAGGVYWGAAGWTISQNKALAAAWLAERFSGPIDNPFSAVTESALPWTTAASAPRPDINVGSPLWASNATDGWGVIHDAIWDIFGAGFTGNAAALAAVSLSNDAARGAYLGAHAMPGTGALPDAKDVYLLLPRAPLPGSVPQPFLAFGSGWTPPDDPPVGSPEPSTWAIIILGVAMTAMSCRKRRTATA